MMDLALLPVVAKYVVPGFFSMLFRIFGLGARSKKAAIAGMAFYLAVGALVPLVCIPLVGYDEYKRYSALVITLANAAVLIISPDGFFKTCFMHLSQANILFWIGITFSALRRMLDLSYLTQTVLLAVFCAGLYAVALRYWAKPLYFMGATIRTGWLGLLAVPGGIILAGIAVSMWFGMEEHYNELMMLAVTSLLEISFVAYLHGLYRSLCEITTLSRENMRQQLLENELEAYNGYLATAKQSRHDLRHHNALLLDYLETGNVAGAIDYLRTNEKTLAESALPEFTTNPAANAVLRIYSRRAQAGGIAFSASAALPATLPMNEPEFCALLSNLLENGVEACAQVAPGARSLAFCAKTDETGLRLEVRNSVAGVVQFENGLPLSTKQGGGTGTKSVAATVKSHGGMLRFKQEGSTFFAQVLFPALPPS
ncbi:MAG: GHKL domain-containing protein [Gemmiger sp.]|nr:GHKL domain-containing protein [Gemmiger sp.]